MTELPLWPALLTLVPAAGALYALYLSGRGWRSVRTDRRIRVWIRAMRRSAERHAGRLPEAFLLQPPSAERAWRRLVRRGRRRRSYSAAVPRG